MNSKYIWLTQNLMYCYVGGENVDFIDYRLENCNGVNIINNIYRSSVATSANRRHVSLENGSRYVRIFDHTLKARTTIPPYYFDSTVQDVELRLPQAAGDYDLATYPARLWQSDSDNDIYVSQPNTIVSQKNSADESPVFELYKQSASPAVNDFLASVNFNSDNNANETTTYAKIRSQALNVTNGIEDGKLVLLTSINGVLTTGLELARGVSVGQINGRGTGSVTIAGNGSLFVGLGSNTGIYSGVGVPNGVVTATVGSLYLRTDGGPSSTLYVKESGSGNTGWVAK